MSSYSELSEAFQERYRIAHDPAMLRAERKVLGSDYGAASYTTMKQADDLADILELGPGKLLLDIGSGAGWPGNYLAASTGCHAILTDPVVEGMWLAVDRAESPSMNSTPVVASGTSPPFRDDTFDASTSSDAF